MRLKFGVSEGFRLTRTLLKFSNRSIPRILYSLIKNARSRGESKDLLLTMFGKRVVYSGVLLCNKGRILHSLYFKLDNGRVKEIGKVNLKNRKPRSALRELHQELLKMGEASRVICYERGGGVLFHPA